MLYSAGFGGGLCLISHRPRCLRILKRLFRVTIPLGIRQGSNLRLVGLGKAMDSRRRGDLFLKVLVP